MLRTRELVCNRPDRDAAQSISTVDLIPNDRDQPEPTSKSGTLYSDCKKP